MLISAIFSLIAEPLKCIYTARMVHKAAAKLVLIS